jgi:hypothetical protein
MSPAKTTITASPAVSSQGDHRVFPSTGRCITARSSRGLILPWVCGWVFVPHDANFGTVLREGPSFRGGQEGPSLGSKLSALRFPLSRRPKYSLSQTRDLSRQRGDNAAIEMKIHAQGNKQTGTGTLVLGEGRGMPHIEWPLPPHRVGFRFRDFSVTWC